MGKARTSESSSAADNDRQTRAAALRLLSKRDHSRQELFDKLSVRGHDPHRIDSVVQSLADEAIIDDRRFAIDLAERRRDKGYGPLAIRAKLRSRGLGDDDLNAALDAMETDWVVLASEALLRRFDAAVLSSRASADRARVARFLQSRGFGHGVARRAADRLLESTADGRRSARDFDDDSA